MKPSLITYAEESKKEQQLREVIARLTRQLEKANVKKGELARAAYQAAADAIEGFVIPTTPKPNLKSKTSGDEEVAILLTSDWQLGKRTPTYSTAICEERIKLLAEKVKTITQIQRHDHPVKELHIHLIGDLVEGELIFPGQAHRIDASLFRQVIDDGPRILVGLIQTLLGEFEKVKVLGVIGNHGGLAGRNRKEMHPESNADMFLYRVAQHMLAKEPRLEWDLPAPAGERAWYVIDKIGTKKFFLAHGDQFKSGGGFGGLPFYGFARGVLSWASGVIEEGFDYCEIGHWHQSASIPYNHRILWVNGSTESGNTWLKEELKAQCPPSQWLLFTHPKNGVTSEHRVWLS